MIRGSSHCPHSSPLLLLTRPPSCSGFSVCCAPTCPVHHHIKAGPGGTFITVLQAAVCRPLTLTYRCVDAHRQSRTRGLRCGAVRLPGGRPNYRLQQWQLRSVVLRHCCHRFRTRWEPSQSDRCSAGTQRTTTLEELHPGVVKGELSP